MSTQRCRERDIEIPSIVDSRGIEKWRLVLRESVNRKERKEAESTPSRGSCQIFLIVSHFSSNDRYFVATADAFSDSRMSAQMRCNQRIKAHFKLRQTCSECDPASLSAPLALAMIRLAIGGNFPPSPSVNLRLRRVENEPVAPVTLVTARGIEYRTEMAALELRVGHGHDTHRLSRGRKLILGGVPIDFERGSGRAQRCRRPVARDHRRACSAPPAWGTSANGSRTRDPKWAGADSAELLKAAVNEVGGRRLEDREPRLHDLGRAAAALAVSRRPFANAWPSCSEIAVDNVNVKAKTGEGVGPVGRQEAIDGRRRRSFGS